MIAIEKKSRNFVKKCQTVLIVSGILIASLGICRTVYVYHKKACAKSGLRGLVIGFHEAINWFDSEFSELNLNKLYNDWAKAHPEEILYI